MQPITPAQFLANFNKAIVDPLILLLIAVAVAYFFWGLVQFVTNSGDGAKRAEGKKKIVWGLVGLFIMVSVFGIIQIVLGTFDISAPAAI